MSVTLGSLPLRTKIKMGGFVWQIADITNNDVTLMATESVALLAIDASSSGGYSNVRYSRCDVFLYLNSNDFLSKFTQQETALLKETKVSNPSSFTYVQYAPSVIKYETVTGKVHMPSCYNLGLNVYTSYANPDDDGSQWPIFQSDEDRKVTGGNYTTRSITWNSGGTAPYHYTYFYYITSSGSTYKGDSAVRRKILPYIVLDTAAKVKLDGENYIPSFNEPPSAPINITVPQKVQEGENLIISWGAASDPDGNLAGYVLERQLNDGVWTMVYNGTASTFADMPLADWNTVRYRVCARDTDNEYSPYTDSPPRTVIHNHAPVIVGSGTDMGEVVLIDYNYMITDEDSGDQITVTEMLDGKKIREYTAVSGQKQKLQIIGNDWTKVLNGQHTLKIIADDGNGGRAEQNVSFLKKENTIKFTLAEPFPTDDDSLLKTILSITGQIPATANVKIELCNNGYDASPTWENATTAWRTGQVFFFQNIVKTSGKWGYNVRITIDRNGSVGDCYLQAIGGVYE